MSVYFVHLAENNIVEDTIKNHVSNCCNDNQYGLVEKSKARYSLHISFYRKKSYRLPKIFSSHIYVAVHLTRRLHTLKSSKTSLDGLL